MGFTKDQWTRPEQQADGTIQRVRNARWGKGKRWLAVWHDPDGGERSRAFAAKEAAARYWQAMETDRDRGEYFDPRAGRELLGDIGTRWLASRVVDPATLIRYESLWRLHVSPAFGRRPVKAIRPSEVQAWLAGLDEKFGSSTAAGAYLVLQACLELAIADEQIKRSPAKSRVVTKPRAGIGGKVQAWSDNQAWAVIDSHPEELRLLPELMATCGLRIGEAMAVALEDFDFAEQTCICAGRSRSSGESTSTACPRTTASGTFRCPVGPPLPSVRTSRSPRPGRAPFPGRSSRGSPPPITSCSGGLMTATSGTGPTASRCGSPRWPEPA